MRLIDADAIPWEGFPNDFGEYHEDYVEKRVVDKMPTIEARPVVRGEWIHDSYTHRNRCSVCEAYQPYDTVGDYIDYWDCDFCPNCGADMRGEEDG